jgi:hypothetical protein
MCPPPLMLIENQEKSEKFGNFSNFVLIQKKNCFCGTPLTASFWSQLSTFLTFFALFSLKVPPNSIKIRKNLKKRFSDFHNFCIYPEKSNGYFF